MASKLNLFINRSVERIAGPDKLVVRTKNRKKVVMMHAGRSGSTVLGDLLNQHDMIYWDGEIFNGPGLIPSPAVKFENWQKWSRSKFFPDRPFDFIANRCTVSTEPVFGFEMKYVDLRINEIDETAFANRLPELEINHVINLSRRNLLKWLVSHLVAKERAKFHYKEGEKSELSTITLNIMSPNVVGGLSMFDLFQRNEQEAKRFESELKTKDILNLTYEDHIENDPTEAYRRVCDFLKVPERRVKVRFTRATPFSLRDVVINFDELAESVNGTKYEWMLNE